MPNNTVSEPVASFFMDQCVGKRSGEMALVPNNPVLYSLFAAHSALDGRKNFIRFIRQVADQLEKDQPF